MRVIVSLYFVVHFVLDTANVDGLMFVSSKECLRVAFSVYKVELAQL